MAAINDLIAQIEDIALRERIAKEVDRLSKQKNLGLCSRSICRNVRRFTIFL